MGDRLCCKRFALHLQRDIQPSDKRKEKREYKHDGTANEVRSVDSQGNSHRKDNQGNSRRQMPVVPHCEHAPQEHIPQAEREQRARGDKGGNTLRTR